MSNSIRNIVREAFGSTEFAKILMPSAPSRICGFAIKASCEGMLPRLDDVKFREDVLSQCWCDKKLRLSLYSSSELKATGWPLPMAREQPACCEPYKLIA